MRIADRFGGTIDGALYQLGYAPPTPRLLRRLTLACLDAAAAESLYRAWQDAATANKPPEFDPDQARFFKALLELQSACPGCGGVPGEDHGPGCPYDVEGE